MNEKLTHHGVLEWGWYWGVLQGFGLSDQGERCEVQGAAGARQAEWRRVRPWRKGVQGSEPSGVQRCWRPAGWAAGSVVLGKRRPGRGGDPRSGCAAGAGSA